MDGILILDKPEGFTSFDCVAKLRGIYRMKKVGHGGTLDPMATGVLPVFFGNATKTIQYAPDSTKEYVAGVSFGVKTDTGDRTGSVTETSDVFPEREALLEVLDRFKGKSSQIPPMYSAIKVNGKKLYDLARAGKTVDRKQREIEIYSLDLLEYDPEEKKIVIRVGCSSGTYIRTLAEDIAEECGSCATLNSLRRTMCMGFREEEAVTFDDLAGTDDPASMLKSMLSVFDGALIQKLGPKDAERFINGAIVGTDAEPGRFIKVMHEDKVLGIAINEHGHLKKLIHISQGD